MNETLIIIGAGGHGKVLAELAIYMGHYIVAGFFDDGAATGTEVMPGLKVLGKIEKATAYPANYFIVGIGNNLLREDFYFRLKTHFKPATLIHPQTSISPSAVIGEGSVILPGAVISYACNIGENCIIGSHTHLDHESEVGSHAYLKAGTLVGSNCKIKNGYCSDIGQIIPAFTEI